MREIIYRKHSDCILPLAEYVSAGNSPESYYDYMIRMGDKSSILKRRKSYAGRELDCIALEKREADQRGEKWVPHGWSKIDEPGYTDNAYNHLGTTVILYNTKHDIYAHYKHGPHWNMISSSSAWVYQDSSPPIKSGGVGRLIKYPYAMLADPR